MVIPADSSNGKKLPSLWLIIETNTDTIIMTKTPIKAKPINRSMILKVLIQVVY